jgi:hypothetical protein
LPGQPAADARLAYRIARVEPRRNGLPPADGTGNTAEPSGELSVGDVVAVGEAGLAVGRAGWTLVRGGLTEVRTSEHGTRPLPARGRLPGTADRPPIPCPDQGAT